MNLFLVQIWRERRAESPNLSCGIHTWPVTHKHALKMQASKQANKETNESGKIERGLAVHDYKETIFFGQNILFALMNLTVVCNIIHKIWLKPLEKSHYGGAI